MNLRDILNDRRTIYFVILVGLILRLVIVLSADPYGADTVDGQDYHASAISLLTNFTYPLRGSLPFIRPPLYPFFLSGLYAVFPHESYTTARLFNIVLDLSACFVFYKLIMLVWRDRATAVISSLIYVVNPLFIFFCAKVRVEALFTLLVVSGVYLLVREAKRGFPSVGRLFGIGLVFGLVSLCRSNGTAILMLIPIWLIASHRRELKKGLLLAVLFVLGCVVMISPWSVRNYIRYGEPIMITDGFGYAFWISNTELKFDDLNARTHDEYLAADAKLWRDFSVIEEQIKDRSVKQRDSYYFNLGVDYIKQNFGRWIWLNVLKSAEFWSPMARYDMHGKQAFGTLPFGLIMYFGLFFYARSYFGSRTVDPNFRWMVLILIIASMGTGVLTWSSVRFRVPLIDPYVIPFGIAWLVGRLGLGKSPVEVIEVDASDSLPA